MQLLGKNPDGRCGSGQNESWGEKKAVAISLGRWHTGVLWEDGTVALFGYNY